jgi:hypothetical protein
MCILQSLTMSPFGITIKRKNKLVLRYFGLFKIKVRVENVVYHLELPKGTKVHLTFHISILKRNW